MFTTNALIVFVRNPELGKVKTRLAEGVGSVNALTIYKALLAHTQQLVCKIDAATYVYYHDWINHNDGWNGCEKHLQTAGDLGNKMEHAIQSAMEKGHQRVVIIGSDCYDLTTAILQASFDQLIQNQVVIGPATDGGYYLLGMQAPYRSLMKNISWSTAAVFEQTMQQIVYHQLTVATLPVLSDVDTEADLPVALQALLQPQ